MQLSRYIKIYPYKKDPEYLLFYSTKKTSSALLHKSLLTSIEKGDLSSPDEAVLADLGFLVNNIDEERNEMLAFMDRVNSRSKRFNAIVVMNLDCNLACVYCFEEGMKGKRYMSQETAGLLVSFMENRIEEGLDIHIDFYGGEPLLSFDMIKTMSAVLKESAKTGGVKYTFNLVTNGTLLTGKRAEELSALGMQSAKITLDGPAEFHDRSRPFKSGAGSFSVIVKNIGEASSFTKIQIGGNFTERTYRAFPGLLDYLLQERLSPEKFLMVKFDPVVKASGFPVSDFREGSESADEPWLVAASTVLREEIMKRGFSTPRVEPAPCMVELKNDIAVNYDGGIYKCPGFIGRKEFEAGDLATGMGEYGGNYNLELWKNDECLGCAYLPLCFGGCRYMKFLRDGKVDGVDCRKRYLDAALEPFILQDVEYGQKAEG